MISLSAIIAKLSDAVFLLTKEENPVGRHEIHKYSFFLGDRVLAGILEI